MKIETIDRLLDSPLEGDIMLGIEYIKYQPLKVISKLIADEKGNFLGKHIYHSRRFNNRVPVDKMLIKREEFILFYHANFILYSTDMEMADELLASTAGYNYKQEFLTPKIKQK